jgi:DNA repair/transcription protein MET18/MMS19
MEVLSKVLAYMQTVLDRHDCEISPPRLCSLLTAVVHLLVENLCSRFENREQLANNRAGVEYTARSLLHLAEMTGRFLPTDASAVAKAVFSLTTTILRAQKAPARLALYDLLQWLVQTYSAPLTRDMGSNAFIESLAAMSATEKDAKCLRVLFQIYEQISKDWSLTPANISTIYESFSKYWPVSIRAATEDTDPSIPRADELNLLIQKCFTSHDGYATHAFGQLLTALDASQANTAPHGKVRSIPLSL